MVIQYDSIFSELGSCQIRTWSFYLVIPLIHEEYQKQEVDLWVCFVVKG